jgi:hypothetical protein
MPTHPALADLGIAPRLLKREQAAAYLSVSPNTFDEMVRDGRASPKIAWRSAASMGHSRPGRRH